MNAMKDYLNTIHEETQRIRMEELIQWIETNFPTLVFKIAWNQPMYTHHDTFIIGLSVAKKHIAISPEVKGIEMFLKDIEDAGYTHSINLFRITWDEKIEYSLLKDLIMFNIQDKAECTSFWRK